MSWGRTRRPLRPLARPQPARETDLSQDRSPVLGEWTSRSSAGSSLGGSLQKCSRELGAGSSAQARSIPSGCEEGSHAMKCLQGRSDGLLSPRSLTRSCVSRTVGPSGVDGPGGSGQGWGPKNSRPGIPGSQEQSVEVSQPGCACPVWRDGSGPPETWARGWREHVTARGGVQGPSGVSSHPQHHPSAPHLPRVPESQARPCPPQEA